MVEFPTRSLRVLVLCRYPYVVAYLEVNLAAVSIRVPTSLFLGLLYNRTSRFPALMYYPSELLSLVSIHAFSSGDWFLWPFLIE